MGEYKRMEAVRLRVQLPEGSTVKVRAHVEGIGWQEPITLDNTGKEETTVGTTGEYRRMEALQITAEGLGNNKILYRAHVEGYGWQDWVDASDPDAFAGTTGEYKRMEALEIAIVSEDGFTYRQNEDGTHTVLYNEKEVKTEKCTFGEMTSTDGKNVDRTCSACKRKETKTIGEVLKDESVTELEVTKIETDEEIVVPEGKTLIVDTTVDSKGKFITVDGSLVLKNNQNKNLKLKGTGTVVYAPEAKDANEFTKNCGKLTQYLKLSGNKLASDATEDAKSLKYEIRVPEMSEPQTIKENDNDALTIGKDWNVTLDLGKNTLVTSDSNTSNKLIVNKGNLTIKNGTVKTGDNNTSAVISSSEGDAKLNLEDVVVTGQKGIYTNGNLTIKGGKVESTADASNMYAIGIVGKTGKRITTVLNDVDVVSKNLGIFIQDSNHDLDMTNGTINITGTKEGVDYALASYSGDSVITLNGTKITSKGIGIYIQNDGDEDEANVAKLNNVTIESIKQCLWAMGLNDRFVVDGGSYTSGSSNALYIFNDNCGLSTLKDCTLSGWDAAINLAGSAKEGEDGNLVLTNVTKNK